MQQVPFQKNWTATLGFILGFVSLISPLGFTVLSPVSIELYQKMDHFVHGWNFHSFPCRVRVRFRCAVTVNFYGTVSIVVSHTLQYLSPLF